MKKVLIILVIALGAISCKKECPEPEQQVRKMYPDSIPPDSVFKRPTVIIKLP